MKKKVTYEQPLNERIRSLLRLEHLFEGIAYCLKGPALWDSRTVISYLIEILDFMGRGDLKTELAKDLEQHAQGLERWQRLPNGDTEKIVQLLNKIKELTGQFAYVKAQEEEMFAQHHLLNVIRQRVSIPGGTCRFDLPIYHYWLQRNPKQRQNDLNEWLTPLEPLREAVELDLYLIRNNATVSQETAPNGVFQSTLDANNDYQLIRVNLPIECYYYPEMSGGRHRFSVRFFEQKNFKDQPIPTEQDVHFELCCCSI